MKLKPSEYSTAKAALPIYCPISKHKKNVAAWNNLALHHNKYLILFWIILIMVHFEKCWLGTQQTSFLTKIQNRISEKTRKKIVLLSCRNIVKTQFLGVHSRISFNFLNSIFQGSRFSFQVLNSIFQGTGDPLLVRFLLVRISS